MGYFRGKAFTQAILCFLLLGLAQRASGADGGVLYDFAGNRHLRVRSLVDLNTYIHSHIERVVRLGVELRRRHLPEVPEKLLREFLELHDQSKVNISDTFVREFKIDRKNLPFLEIARIWNRNDVGTDGTEEERALVMRMRHETNRIDGELNRRFFQIKGLLTPDGKPNAMAEKLLLIEKVADRVDRAKSPVSVEEFNRPMSSAVSWLESPREKELAVELEHDWKALTRGASYEDFRAHKFHNSLQATQPSCQEAFGRLMNSR